MSLRRRFQKNRRSSQGQSLVEFALILPVLILIMIGIIEFGFFFFIYSTVNNSAREAVRYGAAIGIGENGAPYYQDCVGIREVAKRLGRYAGVQDGDVEIDYDGGPGTTVKGNCGADPALVLGDRIVVRVSVTYNPIVIQLNIQPILIEVHSARTIVKSVDVLSSPPTLTLSPEP